MTDPYDQKLARILVRPLHRVGIHPNTVTGASLLLGLASALVFAYAEISWRWLAALLFMLAVFVDHMDGELARLSGKTTAFGHYFDYIVGAVNYTVLFSALGFAVFRETGMEAALWLGIASGISNLVIVSLRLLMENRFGAGAVSHPAAGGVEIEDFIYAIGPITWFGGLFYFFWAYAIGTLIYFMWTVFELLRRVIREKSA